MNAKMLPGRTGMLFAIVVATALPTKARAEAPVAAPQVLAVVTQTLPAVVDSKAIEPLDLLLFVHRPDLPLRAAPIKHKEHS
ncbi:hypothetical protein [Thauera sp.]|jgi:hypothetical protein|uniref:hypothetical protein n=1 Tax=Thauera sp. TaxID=1905334 RepID=UPI00262F5E8F|nr:hypothetical protein [Thauera sp.]MCK6408781.1 hypothetical protein [Thauera sp.]